MPDAHQILRDIFEDAARDRAVLLELHALNKALFEEGNMSRLQTIVQQAISNLSGRKRAAQLCKSLATIRTKQQAVQYLFPILQNLPPLENGSECQGIVNPVMSGARHIIQWSVDEDPVQRSPQIKQANMPEFLDDTLLRDSLVEAEGKAAVGDFNVLQERPATANTLRPSFSLGNVHDVPPAVSLHRGSLKKSPSFPRYQAPPTKRVVVQKKVVKSQKQQFEEIQEELRRKHRQQSVAYQVLTVQSAPAKLLKKREAILEILREMVTSEDERLLKVSPAGFVVLMQQLREALVGEAFTELAQGYSLREFVLVLLPILRQETIDALIPQLNCCTGHPRLDAALIEAGLCYLAEGFLPQLSQTKGLVIPGLRNKEAEVPEITLEDCT